MTERLQIYKCEICGNMVEVIHASEGQLVCCGQPMKLFVENTVDAAKEKHIPVLANNDHGVLVKVGEIAHPMEKDHYIEWIELISPGGKADRQFLKPGEVPEASFCCVEKGVTAREYCNKHGLWKR